MTKNDELRSCLEPAIEHFTTIERRTEWPPARVICTCGFDAGWQASLIAEQDAEWHREQVAAVQVASTITIERKHEPARAHFRWVCTCGRAGAWLASEVLARRSSVIHTDCERRQFASGIVC